MTHKTIQSIPVVRASSRDYELAALVGDDAVILGWTMDDSIDRSDLLGFAVKRTRRNVATRTESDCRWLPSDRRFATQKPGQKSDPATTRSDPLQQFFFLDYAVQIGNAYTYSVQPVRGTPTLRYYEAPVTVTVRPRSQGDVAASRVDDLLESAGSATILPCPLSAQQHRTLTTADLAANVQKLCDAARSAVFLYSAVPLPGPVLDVIRGVNSGRLLYGMVPGRDDDLVDVRRAHNTVHLSQPVAAQKLEPVTVLDAGDVGLTRYTSALVTDPWSRSPGILLFSHLPGTTPQRRVETRLISRDKRAAAKLAVSIFQAYATGRLPQVGQQAGSATRRLEPDGRWSNIYFSRHAASHKFREREIFSGHP